MAALKPRDFLFEPGYVYSKVIGDLHITILLWKSDYLYKAGNPAAPERQKVLSKYEKSNDK